MDSSISKSAAEHLIKTLPVPVFLAGIDNRNHTRLTLHITKAGVRYALKREIHRRLQDAGYPHVRCDVKRHKPERLDRAETTQKLLHRFNHDEIVYDPTASIQRARAVLMAAQGIRRLLKDKVVGICFDAWQRTLYIGLDQKAFKAVSSEPLNELLEVEADIRKSLAQELSGELSGVIPTVRVCFGMPRPPAVPVDNDTLHRICKICKKMYFLRLRSLTAAFTALFGFGLAGSAAAEGPAVSATNAKMAVGGGTSEGDGTGQFLGSVTTPLGHAYGVQLDGLGGKVDGEARWGVGAHLFWRDPDKGLLGAIASYNKRSNKDAKRFGAEGEWYQDQFTVSGSIGGQTGDIKGGFFGDLDLRWYVNDNAYLSMGGLTSSGKIGARVSAEYQSGITSLPGLSLFADGIVADDFDQVLIGVRYYFGETKSLKRRHREDDPRNHNLGVIGFPEDRPPPVAAGYGGGGAT